MELAIPLIALGGMYVISNQSNTNCEENENREEPSQNTENFVNMGAKSNYLPNQNIPPQNFPVPNLNQVIEDTTQNYPNPNTATDKYFDQNVYQDRVRNSKKVTNTPQQVYSMTGDYLDTQQFKHNNMVPFNGGKVKGYTYNADIADSQLDNMIGSGSTNIKKIEQAPLFKPEDNISWAYGTPNNSDFYQSRQNPAIRNNNVKPFETVMVGPGLNKGYGVSGSGGYNSGMESRDKWLPPTVDELRVETNPKLEYELINHEGPANSYIKTAATTDTMGRVEKQRPDTYFINSQDRWFTTTGAEKGETLRSIQEMGLVKRNDIVTDYKGPAGPGDMNASYAPENYEPAKRVQDTLSRKDIGISCAQGKGPIEDGDHFKSSHTNYANNRSTTRNIDSLGQRVTSSITAAVAPLLDILRPTRKSESINNVRIYGDVQPSIPKGPVYNPEAAVPTTIRETTQYETNFNINNQREGTYVNNYTPTDLTQRDTTSVSYAGASGGAAAQFGDMSYYSAYNQHNNDIKSSTIYNHPNQGGTQIFNQQMNVVNKPEDNNRFDGRMNPAFSSSGAMPPSKTTYGDINMPQYYDECQTCDRIQPDILSAFKNNPYTHSLTTSV
jgi:hypothetical protein